MPEDGLLFGGQPSEEQLRAVVAAGYSVIDLRADSEDRGFDEPALLEALSARYTAIPVSAQTLQSAAPIEAFLRVMGELERPALIHCASSNRVGALYYAYLVKRQGVDRAEALERARKGGLSSDELRAVVDRWLDLP